VLIGSSKLAYDVAYPLLVGFSSIPKVAVVPIFVVWFGAGTVPAVLTSMVISIFPVVVNVATGLASTEPELEDVLKVLGASKRDVLFNVSLPRALPYLFASLKIAITLAFVGTVLSETVAANKGIGNVMMIASGNFDVPMVFAGLVILAVMGVHAVHGVVLAREPHDRLGAAQERLRDGVRSMTHEDPHHGRWPCVRRRDEPRRTEDGGRVHEAAALPPAS
jgi:ABC-type nitrate/sulfonate/bicarbonate transport system permease component